MEVWNKSKTSGGVHKCQFVHLDLFIYFVRPFFHSLPCPITSNWDYEWHDYEQPSSKIPNRSCRKGNFFSYKVKKQVYSLQQGPRNYRWQAPTAEIRNTCSIGLECLVLRLYGQCELCITLFSVKSYHELSSQNYKKMNVELIKEINLCGAGWKDMYQCIFMTTINICVVWQWHKFSQRG